VLNTLIAVAPMLALYSVIIRIVRKRDEREEEEKQRAFARHRQEQSDALRASIARQSDLRKSEFARRQKERREKNVDRAVNVLFYATFPYWYWKDMRETRRELERIYYEREAEHEMRMHRGHYDS